MSDEADRIFIKAAGCVWRHDAATQFWAALEATPRGTPEAELATNRAELAQLRLEEAIEAFWELVKVSADADVDEAMSRLAELIGHQERVDAMQEAG